MGFKEDSDFARFLSMGVLAAAHITDDLNRHGHEIIELERYAKANKIWQIKVKRMRLPDLICIKCGRRFESKGKSKLEVKLSDSDARGREWYAGGMRPKDVFCFAQVDLGSEEPEVGTPIYVTREALEFALPSSREGNRKPIKEGAELDLSWPVWIASQDGEVIEVLPQEKKLVIRKADGRRQTYVHAKQWDQVHHREVGDHFKEGEPIAASFKLADVTCPGHVWDWFSDLYAKDEEVRYPAVKAAKFLIGNRPEAKNQLREIAVDESADWRTRVEALTSLSEEDDSAVSKLCAWALSEDSDDAERMEAVLSLSEVSNDEAKNSLFSIASSVTKVPSEIRAAAAWGLGFGNPAIRKLLDLCEQEDPLVVLHAASALPDEIDSEMETRLRSWLRSDTISLAALACHLAVSHGREDLLVNAVQGTGGTNRRLALLALGETSGLNQNEAPLDSASKEILSVLRSQSEDWLRAPEYENALEALADQRLRL